MKGLIIGKYYGNRISGVSYTRVNLTEIYLLSGMKSCWDDLIARTKTGRGCFVLASIFCSDCLSLSSTSPILTVKPLLHIIL
jgi:hypothetical protein